MTEQCYFEAALRGNDHPGRVRARHAKRLSAEQRRKEKLADAHQRRVMQVRSMIASLGDSKSALEVDLAAALSKSWVRDPNHYLFPVAARNLIARRDNLIKTISALSKQQREI